MSNLSLTVSRLETKPEHVEFSLVEIFLQEDKLGEYIREYPHYSETTFAPFKSRNGNWYALYAPKSSQINLMRLPECRPVEKEKAKLIGFCAMEIWVPSYYMKEYNQAAYGVFDNQTHLHPTSYAHLSKVGGPYENYLELAFVGGCYWGDDNSMKVQVIDLTRVEEGILSMSEPFGYFETTSKSLRESIELELDQDEDELGNISHCLEVKITGTHSYYVPEIEKRIHWESH